jgi:hypothetical protein
MASWVTDAVAWLERQTDRSSSALNVGRCRSVWTKLANGEGIAHKSRPDDVFCAGVKVDPRVHDIGHLCAASKEWVDPRPPKEKVPGVRYDMGKGWCVDHQLALLKKYAESGIERASPLVVVSKPFKGATNAELKAAKAATGAAPPVAPVKVEKKRAREEASKPPSSKKKKPNAAQSELEGLRAENVRLRAELKLYVDKFGIVEDHDSDDD